MQREELGWAAVPTSLRCNGLRPQSWKEPAMRGERASGVHLPLLRPLRSACFRALQCQLAPCRQLTAPALYTLALVSVDFRNVLILAVI